MQNEHSHKHLQGQKSTMFKAILTALVYGYTIIIMLGMGASIDIDVPADSL